MRDPIRPKLAWTRARVTATLTLVVLLGFVVAVLVVDLVH